MRNSAAGALAGCAALAAAVLAACGTTAAGGAGQSSPPATVTVTSSPSTPATTGSAGSQGACPVPSSRLGLPGVAPVGLSGVQFVSPQQGWVVGSDRILATSDGGAHWQVQDRGRLGLSSVDFINASDGWAVSLSTVLATTDGGAHWAALPEPCPPIDAVHFVSPTRGFAVAGGTALPYQPVPLAGGVLLATGDGGRTWHRLTAPADAQSVCFTDPARGWLGAHGRLYRTVDGGAHWALAAGGVTGADGGMYSMTVQCAGPAAVWALDLGSTAAAGNHPWLGFHADSSGVKAVFAELYFPHPGVTVAANAPGPYPGPLSAISPDTAAVIGTCSPCGYGAAPWDLLTGSGAVISPRGNVGGLTAATGAAFLSPSLGWVVGHLDDYRNPAHQIQRQRIVMTSDGGRTWHIQYGYLP